MDKNLKLIEDMENERIKKVEDLNIIDDELMIYLKNNGFFTQWASINHHGNYDGGLFDHSYVVYLKLQEYTNKLGLVWERPESPFIVGFFHDLCKIDAYKVDKDENGEWAMARNKEMLLHEHGIKSVVLLQRYLKLTDEEIACITYHMGAYTSPELWDNYGNAVKLFPNVLYTHASDMYVSHVLDL